MWSATVTRVASSSVFLNSSFLSSLMIDIRSATTTSTATSAEKDWTVIARMRELRARSPYALFVKHNYGEISSKHPNLKLVEVSKKVAEAWRNLDEEKKQSYNKLFQEQKSKYEEEKNRLTPSDLQTVDADEKARRLENRVKKSVNQLPNKRPRSAYAHFLSTLDRGEADIKEFMKGAAQRWTQLSEDEKQKFEELHQEEKQKYLKALVAWAAANENLAHPKSKRSASASPEKVEAKQTKTKTKKPRAKSAPAKKKSKKKSV